MSAGTTPAYIPARMERFSAADSAANNNTGQRLRNLSEAGVTLFGHDDTTAGSETELQAAVVGARADVDLPLAIEKSRFYANLVKRAQSGEAPERQIERLRSFLDENPGKVWENSWVRFEYRTLSPYARRILNQDLKADKHNPGSAMRRDCHRFQFTSISGQNCLRIPVSYLIKLALADIAGIQNRMPAPLRDTACKLQDYFLNDNTSPETLSFHITSSDAENNQGMALARETAQRYLFTQLMIAYANDRFELKKNAQEALVYCAPHPPQRQKHLNELIPDTFYRELFMSPCLSGWDRGEDKHTYMNLCHQVLSRSQLNAVAKLREAGIITRNLVVLPNMSNISLANNGVHVSIGSRTLSAHMKAGSGTWTGANEKCCADLSIKIQEHFLPLFVGSYSGAPYRIGFENFHPERALGFLPHELDFTHLRMLWRRWKKKADLKVFGKSITPFGPEWLDTGLRRSCRLRGDFVPDFRLVDYPAGFLSTAESPAHNGCSGNQDKLAADLDAMGVFDARMSLYQFIKMRPFSSMGFSGFEGRYYSLFSSFGCDMAAAVTLQQLITALSFKYMAQEMCTHRYIPDTPQIESERRQIFFARAINLPTFYVRRNTRNRFLLKIMRHTRNKRNSRRYPGYIRVYVKEYCLALLEIIQADAQDLIEELGCAELLQDLWHRIELPEQHSASGKLTRAILNRCGQKHPLDISAHAFNCAAEDFYRTDLRRKHIFEALDMLSAPVAALQHNPNIDHSIRRWLEDGACARGVEHNFATFGRKLAHGNLEGDELLKMINIVLSNIHADRHSQPTDSAREWKHAEAASVYRAC